MAMVDDSGVVEAEIVSTSLPPDVLAPCPACGAPREGNANFCGACGTPIETLARRDTAPAIQTTPPSKQSRPSKPAVQNTQVAGDNRLPDHTFQCQNCGSEVATSSDQRSYVCPFCDSAYVIEIPTGNNRQRPEFVIGFRVTADQAKERFYQWLGKNSWFRPGDLAKKAVTEKQKGVYLPFWHFSMHADSDWVASIGEYWYRTETYTTTDSKGKTVTRTRQVRETEWFPLSGEHHRYYFGHLVPATRGITAKEAQEIQPFQLASLTRYRPHFLAGWMAEEYSIPMDEAIEQTKAEFIRRQEKEVGRFLPGDTYRSLRVQTRLSVNGSDLILLPVHVLSYRYKDQVFRFLVNGQNGLIVGEKPWSRKRVAAVSIGIAILVIAAVVALIIATNR